MLTAPTEKNPKSFTFTVPRELPSISANRVQHASSRLSNIYLINLPKIQSALTLLSTLRLAFMAFCNAPCYKYGVQRWKVQRYHSKLTKHTMINHNQKCFMKNSPLQKKCFMGFGLAEKCNKITWNNNVLPLQSPFPIQYNTTVVLPTILIEPTVPATSYNYVTVTIRKLCVHFY